MKKLLSITLVVLLGSVSAAACGSSGSNTARKESGPHGAGSPDFGTLKNVCHPAKSPNKANSDRGVTAKTVQVTTISDAGSPTQRGLNQELWDAATVFTKWCNDHGGINGRRIIETKGDAQVTLYPQAIAQACASSFALVGGGGALDQLAQDTRLKCLLPDIPGFTASSQARTAALSYPAQSNPVNKMPIGGLKTLNKLYPGSIAKAATVYGDFPSIKISIDQDLIAAQALWGLPPVPIFQDTYPVSGTTNWKRTAAGIQKYGVQSLIFAGQPKDLVDLLIAVKATGYTGLKWAYAESNLYDQSVIKQAGALLGSIPIYSQIYVYPFEAAGKGAASSAIDDYLALFKHYLPNGKARAMLGLNAFASWLLFAEDANKCGADLDRKCLVRELTAVTTFDAGGLIARRNPSQPSQASTCFTLMKATPTGWTQVPQVDPNEGVFNCNPDNVFNVPATGLMEQYPAGPSLADVGKSLDDLP
jgi:hypothetical protein